MLISVIMAVYNTEKYVASALESILAQTWQEREVIVVDDGSTDGSLAILQAYAPAVQVLAQAHGGVGRALNSGLRQARGELLAFLDADDLWTADKLEIQAAALAQDPGLELVFGHVLQFLSPELDEPARQRLACCPGVPEPYYSKMTLLARRGAFEQVGPFAEDYQAGDFLDWYLRAQEAGLRSRMLPDLVGYRRIHQANTGARNPGSQVDYTRVVRAALARRRQSSGNQPGPGSPGAAA
jgi:glycosyltransferase involved in cell wall biosynthesis